MRCCSRIRFVEDDLGVDLSEVLDVVNTAEVFVVMFQLFERRLLVDTRTTGGEPPLIRVVDRVRNSDERFRELLRLRPQLRGAGAHRRLPVAAQRAHLRRRRRLGGDRRRG